MSEGQNWQILPFLQRVPAAEVVQTQQHGEGDHLPLPHNEALVWQRDVGLQQLTTI